MYSDVFMCRAEQNGLAYLPSAILLGREVVMLPQLALLIRPLVLLGRRKTMVEERRVINERERVKVVPGLEPTRR